MAHKLLAGCVITDEKRRILLIHRNTPRLTQWELPGGKLEIGETPEQAAQREVLEEVGISVRILEALGQAEFEENESIWLYHWFRGEIVEGFPLPCEPDTHDDVGYFDIETAVLTDVALSSNLLALVDAIKKNEVKL
jgi:8-oxo-dGTP diphosphatase